MLFVIKTSCTGVAKTTARPHLGEDGRKVRAPQGKAVGNTHRE